MMGLSTSGSISLGWALVAGRKRVPRPAAGKTALRTFIFMRSDLGQHRWPFDSYTRAVIKATANPLRCRLSQLRWYHSYKVGVSFPNIALRMLFTGNAP